MRACRGKKTEHRMAVTVGVLAAALLAGAAAGEKTGADGSEETDAAVQKLAREVATRGWILFDAKTERGDRDLFLTRPDGSRLRNITNTPELSEIGGRFSPDGKKILYRRLPKEKTLNHDKWGAWGQLVMANADGSDPIPYGKDGEYPWASWSPDGKQIACLEKSNIRIYDMESRTVLKELPRNGIFIQLYWSPDGKRLCGTANVAGQQSNIVAVDAATGEATLLSRKLNCTPDWFQRGSRRVVYSNRTPGLATGYGWTMLMQATSDGESRTLVYAENEQHIYCGCTSPDDKYVILTRSPGDGGINRAMAIIRLTDTPIIVPEYKELKALYPDAGEGPVLHLTHLPAGFEPHWTYADIKEK